MPTTAPAHPVSKKILVATALIAAAGCVPGCDGFVVPAPTPGVWSVTTTRLGMSSPSAAEASTMRVKEIKAELEGLGVDFSDCFDKESLVSRLNDARNGAIPSGGTEESSVQEDASNDENKTEDVSVPPAVTADSEFDEAAVLEELRGLRVRELREELGRRRIPRAGLFEKEDLVRALLKAREAASTYSATGLVLPGVVAELTGEQVEAEISHPGTPLLLDVYATWCGPCKMMAPELESAAGEAFMDTVRVAKMDSDQHPRVAGQLKVNGLPTLVLFSNGEEVDRIEGALMKDQLVEWVQSKL